MIAHPLSFELMPVFTLLLRLLLADPAEAKKSKFYASKTTRHHFFAHIYFPTFPP